MSYLTICEERAIEEGAWAPFTVGDHEVLLFWPEDGELKAYQGRCPHQGQSLKNGHFNDHLVTCPGHQWVFDGRSGQAVHPRGCRLQTYPLRIENNMVQVELDSMDD